MEEITLAWNPPETLVAELRQLIKDGHQVAAAVNAGPALLSWRLGNRIHRETLCSQSAGHGKKIVVALSRQLVREFGRRYAEKNLRRMIQFAVAFPEEELVATLSRDLSWSHFQTLLPLRTPMQREFYAEMSRVERWSVRTLRGRIDSTLRANRLNETTGRACPV